jgi:hypothetical protein
MPRPPLKPTEEQRRMVKSMGAVGIPHEDIGRKIGIRSPKTLRKHFRDELDLGIIDANYKVSKTLYEMAISGDEPSATIFWDKTRNRSRQRPAESDSAAPPAFIAGVEPGDPEDDNS